jgi:hypothetical protein
MNSQNSTDVFSLRWYYPDQVFGSLVFCSASKGYNLSLFLSDCKVQKAPLDK